MWKNNEYTTWEGGFLFMELQVKLRIMGRFAKHKFLAVRDLPCYHGLGPPLDSASSKLDRIDEGNKGDEEEC